MRQDPLTKKGWNQSAHSSYLFNMESYINEILEYIGVGNFMNYIFENNWDCKNMAIRHTKIIKI